MTIQDLKFDGYRVKKQYQLVLFTANESNQIFISHKFKADSEHWTRPLLIGNAKKGFTKFCARLQ